MERLILELERSRKPFPTHVISTISFDHFLGCSHAAKDELHLVQSEFYSKLEDFLNLFFKFQSHVQEGKYL